jgi:hypothetical protein
VTDAGDAGTGAVSGPAGAAAGSGVASSEAAAEARPLPQTGDPRVDDAMSRLAELADLPLAEHLPVYQDVHRRLYDALADVDAG